jgi:alpha-beta hydrolase superfamily lysophospholipase
MRLGEGSASPLISKLSFHTYNKVFAPNRTAFDWLSVNEDNVDWYISHPLCGGNPTTGLFREMLDGIAFMKKPSNVAKMAKKMPILFISGAMDPVGDCSKGVKRAFESFRRAGMQDISLQLYPGLRHEILCETNRQEIFDDILVWLESKLLLTQ